MATDYPVNKSIKVDSWTYNMLREGAERNDRPLNVFIRFLAREYLASTGLKNVDDLRPECVDEWKSVRTFGALFRGEHYLGPNKDKDLGGECSILVDPPPRTLLDPAKTAKLAGVRRDPESLPDDDPRSPYYVHGTSERMLEEQTNILADVIRTYGIRRAAEDGFFPVPTRVKQRDGSEVAAWPEQHVHLVLDGLEMAARNNELQVIAEELGHRSFRKDEEMRFEAEAKIKEKVEKKKASAGKKYDL